MEHLREVQHRKCNTYFAFLLVAKLAASAASSSSTVEQMNELSGPRGLAMDRDGNLLVADTWNVMWLSLEGSEEDQIELLAVICRKHLGASASQ